MYIVKRIIIYLFFVVFSLLSFLYNIHSGCCCFKCTKVETDEEKKERLRREQIEKENALRNKLFNIICKYESKLNVTFNSENVQFRGIIFDDINKCKVLEGYTLKSHLYPSVNFKNAVDLGKIKDIFVNTDGNFVIKHEGVNIVVTFSILLCNSDGNDFYALLVNGDNLPNKLGVRRNGEPIIFYYDEDKDHFEGKNGKIIEDVDKPVENFTLNKFDCLRCSFVSDNSLCVHFYKV